MTIRDLRTSLGLSQGQLARRLGCAQSALSRWERGAVQPAPRYARALEDMGVTMDDYADPDARERANEALLCEYEDTGATLRWLANKHGVHPNTISNRLNRAEDVRRRERIRRGLRG